MSGIYTNGPGRNSRHKCQWRVAGRVYVPADHSYLYRHVCAFQPCPVTREAHVDIPEPKLTERVQHDQLSFQRKWMCDPPAPGQDYLVLACDWGHDVAAGLDVQLIYRIQVL